MDTFWTAAGGWWVQVALSGGAVLLLGWLAMLASRAPGWRQQVGAWAVRGAVLAAGLSLLPHWVLLPRPTWMTSPETMETVAAPIPEPAPVPATATDAPPTEPVEWVFIPRERLRLTELPVERPPASEPDPPSVSASAPPAATVADPPPAPPVSVAPLLLSAYLVVVGVLLLQLVWERVGLAWLLRDATPLVGRARWVLDRLTVDERRPRAVVSARVRTPLCVGFFRPLVVLPQAMADADEPTLRWVLAHELDHLRRGDSRTAHWVGVARAVFFFVPWFWLLRRDLTLCQEYLADAAAAGQGANPADYAAFLVDLSGGRASRRPIAAARMRAGKSDLFRRVHMLLNVKTAAREVSRGFAVVAGTAAVAAAVGLSGVGFADEPKPREERKPVEVEVVKPRADEPRRPAEERVIERRAEANRERLPMRLQPPADVVRQAPRVVTGVENDLRAQYERQVKEFEESIKRAKDAEAKEQLEKARDEYKKAMEEPLKKADEARKELDAARKKMEQAERANRGANDEAVRRLMEMQKRMEQRLLDDLKKFEDFKQFELPLNPDDLKKFEQMFGGGRGFVVGPDGLFAPVQRNLTQPRLGVKIDKVPGVLAEQLDLPKDSGVVIADVTAGSPAEKAGLRKNDVLLKLADKDVPTDPEAFAALVGKLKGGEKVDAVVLRKGKKETVKGIDLPEARQPNRDGRFGGGAAAGGNEQVQVQINNDDVTLHGTVDGVAYTVTGTAKDGKLVPGKIVVKEGRESKEYDSLEKVPEGQRATVERLMGKVRVLGGR